MKTVKEKGIRTNNLKVTLYSGFTPHDVIEALSSETIIHFSELCGGWAYSTFSISTPCVTHIGNIMRKQFNNRNGDNTVSFLKKYFMKKFDLQSEEELGWEFQELSSTVTFFASLTALQMPSSTHSSCNSLHLTHSSAPPHLQWPIYIHGHAHPNFITKPSNQIYSYLIQSPFFTTPLIFIPMENSNLPSTTNTTNVNTTTMYNQQHLTFPNLRTPYHINQTYTYPPPSIMPYPNFYNTSPYPQPYYHNYMQFPYAHGVPVAYPPYAYHVEGSGMVNPMPPNLGQPVLLPNTHMGHMVHRQHSSNPSPVRSNRSSSSSSARTSRRMSTRAASSNATISDQDSYFFTPDNKKLRILVLKELSSSDVGPAGRIVLPKREAQRNLPNLLSNQGMQLVFKDVFSTRTWQMRYTFWSNYKGKMYVLDQIGDFARENRLEMGDSLTLYEDESKNLYFSIKKTEGFAQPPSSTTPMEANQSSNNMLFDEELTDEETSSLKILVDEFKHTDEEANNLMTLLPFSNTTNQQHR